MAKKKEASLFPRPIDNMNLMGHEDVKRSFFEAWSKREAYPMHPVWILSGPKGIGKATLAYSLIRQIFSDAYGRSVENIAEKMSAGGIGDLFIVDIETSQSTTKTIPVDAIKNVIDRLQMSSMSESWRVVVIDSMDELSRDAPNTLLKTLEEPPSKTIFFLIAHSLDRVFPTIRSRSRIEKLHPLSSVELRMLASNLLDGKEVCDDLIKISGGSFGRIAGLVETGAADLYNEAKRLVLDKSADSADCLNLARRIAKFPENIPILLDVIAHFEMADLYSTAQKEIDKMNILHLDPEIVAFKIISEIKKCL